MANRIEIGFRQGIRDALGEKIKKKIIDHLRIQVDSVKTFEVYTIEGDLTPGELEAAARGPLSDPVIQEYAVDRGLARGFDWLIEVGYRPGVTDNVGKTAAEAIALLTGKPVRVYTSRQYAITAIRDRCSLDLLTRVDAQRIASELLSNDLIQRHEIIDGRTWDPAQAITPYVPRVMGEERIRTEEIDLDCPDEALVRISQERVLALSLEEMRILRDYLKNDAVLARRKKAGLGARMTDAELECLAQTWSEHCKHKIFNARIAYDDGEGSLSEIDSLFSTCIKRSTREIRERMGTNDWCLSVFSDNAGIIRFNADWNLVFKVETHNSPSALDPYGGRSPGSSASTGTPSAAERGRSSSSTRTSSVSRRPTMTSPCRSGSSTRGGSTRGCGKGWNTAGTRAASPR